MLGEFVPFAIPQFDALLASMFVIVGAIICIGIVAVLHHFTSAIVGGLGQLLGAIPGLGRVLASPVNAVAHWIDHTFAAAEASLDSSLAWWLHTLGDLVAWVGRELRSHAYLLHALSIVTLGQEALHYIERAIGYVRDRAVAVGHSVVNLGVRVIGLEESIRHATSGYIGAAIAFLIGPVAAELGHLERWAAGKVAGLENTIGGTIAAGLHGLREWAIGLEHEYAALWARVRHLERTLTGEAATAVVAIALTAMGAEWIRCRNWRRIGRGACGLPLNMIEGLLGNAIEALIVTDLCEVAQIIERGAVLFEPVLEELVNAQAFICLAGGAHYARGIVDADLHAASGLAKGIVPADLAA